MAETSRDEWRVDPLRSGMDELFTIHTDLQAAVASFSAESL
jgi:hypothetical protein